MLKTAKICFYVSMAAQGLFWIIFGIIQLISIQESCKYILALLMAADGIAYIVLMLISQKKYLLFKIATFLFLGVNLIFCVTDQAGLWDYLILALNVAALSAYIYILIKSPNKKEDTP